MQSKFIYKCPACEGDMYVSTLKCKNCGIEIKGEFELPESKSTNNLTDEEKYFINLFLTYEGNFSRIQEEGNISYQNAKLMIRDINIKLGNEIPKEDNYGINTNINTKDFGEVSRHIYELLKENGGSSYCNMLKGDNLKIWLSENGVCNDKYNSLVCEWKIFDAIIKKARELGGKMYRGDSIAQMGYKIGSKEFPVDTIDAYISLNFYGRKIGDSTLRRSTYYSTILAWAGICKNCKSKGGEGGYIELMPEWR